MRVSRLIAAAGLCLSAGLAGCSDFLTSQKAVNDPNNPTIATRNQLFVGALANVFGQQEGPVAMIVCEWMQQCAGVNGRFVDEQGTYGITAGSFDGSFQSIYTGGGLIQLKQIEASATKDNDKLMLGITQVLEAMDVLYGTDVWGDMPYSQAAGTSTEPKFDSQQAIYTALLSLLDNAVSNMNGGGAGPQGFDIVYGGDKTKWIQVAHTLKARIYLHEVEKLGPGMYAKALAEAQQGISTPDNDWKTVHTSATSQRNMWAQFQLSSFGNDLVAGSTLVDIMKAQGDPRIADYFGKNPAGTYGGYDVVTAATPFDSISPIAGSNRTNDPTFSQPVITYDEVQLIIAEAQLQSGNVPAAATALNTVRARYGKPAIAAPTLNDIMTEKYILMFQNLEAWNDYKRTCLPKLNPARSKPNIPGRLYYGQTEEQTNPANTPPSSAQNLFTVRNWNDPASCQ